MLCREFRLNFSDDDDEDDRDVKRPKYCLGGIACWGKFETSSGGNEGSSFVDESPEVIVIDDVEATDLRKPDEPVSRDGHASDTYSSRSEERSNTEQEESDLESTGNDYDTPGTHYVVLWT